MKDSSPALMPYSLASTLPIHCYEKSELALLYFPYATPHTALIRLNRWIRRCRPLAEALTTCNQSHHAKYYSAQAVRLIIHYLGDP